MQRSQKAADKADKNPNSTDGVPQSLPSALPPASENGPGKACSEHLVFIWSSDREPLELLTQHVYVPVDRGQGKVALSRHPGTRHWGIEGAEQEELGRKVLVNFMAKRIFFKSIGRERWWKEKELPDHISLCAVQRSMGSFLSRHGRPDDDYLREQDSYRW